MDENSNVSEGSSAWVFIDPQWRRTHRHIWSSERGMDIRDVGAVSPPASEFVRLNSDIRDLVSEALGVMAICSGNWTWVLNRGENGRSGVPYFPLYWRLLYGASYAVVFFFDVGFRISEYHVYHFYAGTLRYDVYMTQAIREHQSNHLWAHTT